MPEGTFGGDLIGITGRVVGGRRGGNFLLQACFSQTVSEIRRNTPPEQWRYVYRRQEANLESIINPESYSSLTKLIRVISLVLLFVEKRVKNRSTDKEKSLQAYKQA